jgi:hypothetical protein
MRPPLLAITFVAVVCNLVLARPASAVLVVGYQVSESTTTNTATSTGTGVTGVNLSRTGVVYSDGPSDTYQSTGWDTGSSVNTAEYLQWGFTSTVAYDLDNLQIRYDRSNDPGDDGGPSSIEIRLSINGSPTYTSIFTDTGVSSSSESQTIPLSTFDNVTSATFRLFGWSAENSDGWFEIENTSGFGNRGIVVNGTAVPEPAAFLFGGLVCGVIGIGAVSRRWIGNARKV